MNGQGHLWSGAGCKLLNVKYFKEDNSYSSPAAYSPQIIEVMVPIAAKAKGLEAVLQHFGIEASPSRINEQIDDSNEDYNYIEEKKDNNENNYFETEF